MHYVYIIHSELIDKFYIGQTPNVQKRLSQHNDPEFGESWSARGIPWTLFFTIECSSKNQAIKIERHIKRMKSKKYIQNLTIYPDISTKLLEKYSQSL